LNNLEYDHADIYPDVAAIRRQFNQLLRTVPGAGRLIVNGEDAELAATLKMGCWTPVETFAAAAGATAGTAGWTTVDESGDSRRFVVRQEGREVARVEWTLLGKHNVMNALAAIAAAAHVGIEPPRAALALKEFRGVKRRMEIRGVVGGVTVYDDFAHHPTAIETTLQGLRARVGDARIVAVVEPRSNTMKLGVHREQLAPALALADRSWFLDAPDLGWDLPAALRALGSRVAFADTVDSLAKRIADESRPGDQILVMSNGGFGGLHDKLLGELEARHP
jgi:UDP-N-acetylmuramate: L-alanyl-gamma-D-glutamyl-meso-diaminopimelate ligase